MQHHTQRLSCTTRISRSVLYILQYTTWLFWNVVLQPRWRPRCLTFRGTPEQPLIPFLRQHGAHLAPKRAVHQLYTANNSTRCRTLPLLMHLTLHFIGPYEHCITLASCITASSLHVEFQKACAFGSASVCACDVHTRAPAALLFRVPVLL